MADAGLPPKPSQSRVKRLTKVVKRTPDSTSAITIPERQIHLSVAEFELREIFDKVGNQFCNFGLHRLYCTYAKPRDFGKQDVNNELLKLRQSTGNGLYSSDTLQVLDILHHQIGSILQEQRITKNAVQLQAAIRRWLIRRHMRLVDEYKSSIKHTKPLFTEIVKTERQYIHDLKTIINGYLLPVRSKASGTEDFADIVSVFSNVEGILDTHQTLLREMLHIRDSYWPFIHGLGTLFLKHAVEFKIYGEYAENYITSRSTLTNIMSNKKHNLHEPIESQNGGFSKLEKLLLQPIQRIAKYSTMLERLARGPEGIAPEELDALSRAQTIMGSIYELVNAKLELADQYAKVQEIQRSITSEIPITLQHHSRCFVLKGFLHSITLKKLTFFLFTDLLLLTRPQGDKFKLLHSVDLSDCSLEASEDTKIYTLTFGNEKLQFKSEKSLENILSIKKQLQKHQKIGSLFGVSLEEILERENRKDHGIPLLVEMAANCVRENGINVEGILRLSGTMANVDKLRKLFDSTPPPYDGINLKEWDVHDVGSVLKIFFRELPEPLVPFALFEPLMDVQRNGSLEREERLNALKPILHQLPPTNITLLKYLVQFLQDIEEHSDVNKMTVSNLAIVFGPNILRPAIESVQTALEMPLAQGVVQLLIEHSRAIWSDAEDRVREAPKQRRKRPLSTLFVGKDLKPLKQEPKEPEKSDETPGDNTDAPSRPNAERKRAYLLAISGTKSPTLQSVALPSTNLKGSKENINKAKKELETNFKRPQPPPRQSMYSPGRKPPEPKPKEPKRRFFGKAEAKSPAPKPPSAEFKAISMMAAESVRAKGGDQNEGVILSPRDKSSSSGKDKKVKKKKEKDKQ